MFLSTQRTTETSLKENKRRLSEHITEARNKNRELKGEISRALGRETKVIFFLQQVQKHDSGIGLQYCVS